MKRNKSLSWLVGALIVTSLLAGCKKDEELKTPPTVSTSSATSINMNTATCGGTIQGDGGAPVTERGICWSTGSLPTIAGSTAKEGAGTGSFTCNLASLQARTTYYVRAYATNSVGTSYGNQITFSTIDFPTAKVTVRVASNTSILCKYEQPSDGGSPVTERGLCWSTAANPTVETGTVKGIGTNDWANIAIDGLRDNTTYHIRAYAKNAGGVGYGEDNAFTTYSWEVGSVTDIDNNTYKTIKIGTQVWMQENLKVTHYRNGDPIPNIIDNAVWHGTTSGAYCWGNNDETATKKFGALYNYYTVVDSRNICPIGWHVPTEAEAMVLLNHYDGDNILTAKKLSIVTASDYGTNESGFSGLYGYGRGPDGTFAPRSVFWSVTFSYGTSLGFCIELYESYSPALIQSVRYGSSVRCIKD